MAVTPHDTEPVPNLPLLRKVLDHIDAHPDEWDQGLWGIRTADSACGTAFCVAGHAVVFSGEHEVTFENGEMRVDGRWWDDDECADAPHVAGRNVLGLTDDEAHEMFDGDNTRTEVQLVAERIAARAGEVL